MIFIFDENLATEKRVNIDSFNEVVSANRISAEKRTLVDPSSTFPDLGGISKGMTFATLKILNKDNVQIPTQGDYDVVSNLSVFYSDFTSEYVVTMGLGNSSSESF